MYVGGLWERKREKDRDREREKEKLRNRIERKKTRLVFLTKAQSSAPSPHHPPLVLQAAYTFLWEPWLQKQKAQNSHTAVTIEDPVQMNTNPTICVCIYIYIYIYMHLDSIIQILNFDTSKLILEHIFLPYSLTKNKNYWIKVYDTLPRGESHNFSWEYIE